MKKILSILAGIVVLVAAASTTTSCKKDIDNAKALAGTYWGATDVSGLNYNLYFKSASQFTMTVTGVGSMTFEGTFIISGGKPSLTGSTILLSSDDESWYDWDAGKFTDENTLRLDHLDFVRLDLKK